MRKFSSYGPIDTDLHYFAPRKELINMTHTQLIGENSEKSGHYITVWAPRQTGKTWLMQQISLKLQQDHRFQVIQINLEHLKHKINVGEIINKIAQEIGEQLGKNFKGINAPDKFQEIFKKKVLTKPLILILDEFDALIEEAISALVSTFRNIYNHRLYEVNKPTEEKSYLLHGVALVGIRSVVGIENEKGSPFNVQRSLHIPNLTFEELKGMFCWYEKESGQKVEAGVIDRLFYETNGQPGLTCWFGELLTETYNLKKDKPITMTNFEEVYAAATYTLPSNNILNIISKVKDSPYREWVLDLFKTDEKVYFRFDDRETNYLYMNGVIDLEKVGLTDYYVRFSSPFVQKRLFNYFSGELFDYLGRLVEPFEKLDNVIDESGLNVRNLMRCYSRYLAKNRDWLLRDAPRRKDLRVFEAVYHFNLYMYLIEFLKSRGGKVYPEFPTGNGKVDLVVRYKDQVYGLELKSFTHETAYKDALHKAAKYGKQLELTEIFLVFFVEYIDEKSRDTYEKDYIEKNTGVTVKPIFIEIGR
jgi:hypothetical protein